MYDIFHLAEKVKDLKDLILIHLKKGRLKYLAVPTVF